MSPEVEWVEFSHSDVVAFVVMKFWEGEAHAFVELDFLGDEFEWAVGFFADDCAWLWVLWFGLLRWFVLPRPSFF